jgi:TRAP-type mannitol/chloroaromatic compound transport system substrate-binding protein
VNWCPCRPGRRGAERHRGDGPHRAYYYFGKNDAFALGCAIPFGLNSRQMTAWMYDGNGLKLMREFYSNYGFTSFPMGNTGAQMGGWYRKEIKTVADMKGLKFRVGGFAGKVTGRLGTVSQNIPGGEIYQALEKGTIDAAEWVGPYDDQKLGFNKVAPIYHYPGWWEGGPQLDLYVNQKAFDGLSAEYKAIIESAAAYAHTEMQAKYDARNPAALKQLVAGKTRLVAFPKPVLDAAFKEAMALYSESAPATRRSRRSTTTTATSAASQPVVPLHRSALRQLHAERQALSHARP